MCLLCLVQFGVFLDKKKQMRQAQKAAVWNNFIILYSLYNVCITMQLLSVMLFVYAVGI